MPDPILLIHGGAGTMHPDRLTPERRAATLAGLRAALAVGQQALATSALDAVATAVAALEDDPLFNAGHGAVFTSAGTIEMDAAIMDGATSRIGALAGINGPRNPVAAARLVMERSPHILLAGPAALHFLAAEGMAFEPPTYFETPDRREALRRYLSRDAPADDFDRHGTVGAVALDGAGRLAAATSTGGMTGKRPGRIGDTPLPGAGTWADQTCAMSATGHGESFIRAAAGHELSARLRYADQSLAEASAAILAAVAGFGGDGGLIAVDRDGNHVMPFNSRGMYRGLVRLGTAPEVAIYGEALG